MSDTLTDAAAIEHNSLAFWRTVCPHLPDAEFHDGPQATWFLTSAPFFPFNQILRVSFAPGEADAAIDGLLARFRSRSLPFCWNVGPASRPPDLATRLQAHSPADGSSMPAMALDLSQPLDEPARPDGLVVERVHDAAALDRWAQAYRDGFDLSERFVGTLRDAYAAIGCDDSAPFRHYIGFLEGAPVACSTMFLDGSAAALWHIATLPKARKRGIGAAMTLQPIRDAHALGHRLAVLYASDMGAPVYRRLGFREHFRLSQYGWQYEGQAL